MITVVISNISSGEQASRLLALACGGGCPLAYVPASVPLLGACVVDLGCGARPDLALASHLVGTGGRTVGSRIDLTPQMVTRCTAVLPTCSLAISIFQIYIAACDAAEASTQCPITTKRQNCLRFYLFLLEYTICFHCAHNACVVML